MADDKHMEELHMRIKELGEQVQALTKAVAAAEVTAEDLKAYRKVRALLDYPEGYCGLNECDRPWTWRPRRVTGGVIGGGLPLVECEPGLPLDAAGMKDIALKLQGQVEALKRLAGLGS